MRWFETSLSRKFALGTASGLLVSSLVFLILFVHLYRQQIEGERANAAIQVTRLLESSLENAMLKRDLDGLTGIIDRLSSQSGIQGVMIANPKGEIRYASDRRLFGRQMPADQVNVVDPVTRFTDTPDGRAVLRSISPVGNKPPCEECHGPTDVNAVNGILYVDFDGAAIRSQARDTTLLLMGSGALIVLINLVGGWWFIRRFVIRPVEGLAVVSERLTAGDLDARATLLGGDELALLGGRFNRMAASLQNKIAELKDNENFMQQLVDAVPDGIRVIDADYRVVLANDTYRRQLGLENDAEMPSLCYAAAHGRDTPCPDHLITCPLAEIGRTDRPLRVIHCHRRRDGGRLDVEIYAAPLRASRHGRIVPMVVESIRDLDQQVKFSHEQKLSELGRLAAGVAHEIHNPLASVRMALHAAGQANEAENPDRKLVTEYLSLVDQEVEKCSSVTERLLRLSVPPPEEHELVSIDRVLDDTLRLLGWDAQARRVDIRLDNADGPLRILATDSELRMVTLNLAQNALHAMPEGGILRVRSARVNGRVEIRFEDTGVGIDPADRLRIFEPFFSRRADGVRGTGLGLSIVKGIVENYSGTLDLDSEPGQGTRVVATFLDADRSEEG